MSVSSACVIPFIHLSDDVTAIEQVSQATPTHYY